MLLYRCYKLNENGEKEYLANKKWYEKKADAKRAVTFRAYDWSDQRVYEHWYLEEYEPVPVRIVEEFDRKTGRRGWILMTKQDENKMDVRYGRRFDKIMNAKRMIDSSVKDYLWATNKFRLLFNDMEQDLLKIQKREMLKDVKQKCSNKKL